MIVNYQIDMLNVEDADAIVLYYLTDDGKKHLVLIDAGRYGDGEKVLRHLNAFYNDIPVELAIVTHPDDDHYGGFIYLLEQISDKNEDAVTIERFWINDPRKHIRLEDVEEGIQQKTLESRLADIYSGHGTDLMTLIEANNIPHQEAFARTYQKLVPTPFGTRTLPTCASSSQIGLTILGPTKEYYEEQCRSFRYDRVTINSCDEAADNEDTQDFEPREDCLSRVLEDAGDDESDHNRSSIIVLFKAGDSKKYLFTGDASVDSFEHMDAPHKFESRNVAWLKVPHHGSKHNLNTKWIKYLHPGEAFISTLRRGQYLNQCTINALKQIGCRVISTHNNQMYKYIAPENILDRKMGIAECC